MPGAKIPRPPAPKPDRYAWIALANTTAAIFMAALDGSIVIIALPAMVSSPGRCAWRSFRTTRPMATRSAAATS